MTIKLRPLTSLNAPSILAIGASTGGLSALSKIFNDISNSSISIPIVITQHMPETFGEAFAEKLSKAANRKCYLAKTGMLVEDGFLYLADSGKHMRLERKAGKVSIFLDSSPPIHSCRPAVDPMFESVAELYKTKAWGLVLTGIGADGLAGGRKIVEEGGSMLAQDEQTSVVWGMPGAVAKAGICTAVLPIEEIGKFLINNTFGKIV